MQLLASHLNKQYQDRCIYWGSRSLSRLPALSSGLKSVTVIIDSIDHTKLRLPRAQCVEGNKDFASFVRPCLDLTCALVHGHGIYLFLSDPFLAKDSNWHTDILAYVLERLSNKCDIRGAEILVQSDNTSREMKNNTVLRALGAWFFDWLQLKLVGFNFLL